jgi:hypothetical protein
MSSDLMLNFRDKILDKIKRIPRYLLYTISGFGVYMFMFTYVKPELAYHLQQLGFSTSKTFLHEMRGYPGGLAEYLSIFLFQYSFNSYTGSIVDGILFFVLLILSYSLFHRRKSAIDTFLIFCPSIITVMLMIDYNTHPVFPILVIIQFLFAKLALNVLGSKLNKVLKLGLLTILLASFYYIAGGFVFLVLCISLFIWTLFSLKITKSYLEILTIVVLAAVIPTIASYFLLITPQDAYMHLVPYFCNNKPGYLLYASVLALPAILILQLPLRFRIKNLGIKKGFLKSEWLQLLQTLMMIGVLGYCLFYNFNEKQKLQHKIQIDKLAYEQKWDEVLTMAKRYNLDDRVSQFHVNRALYFTGNLTDSLFTFPQKYGIDGLFLTRSFSDEMLLPSTELFFDLSFMNEAIHFANEAIAQKENSPYLIDQLILAYLVTDKKDAAQLYINVLKDFPVFKKKAENYQKFLNGEGFTEIDKLIQEKRSLMPVTDFKVNRQVPSEDLLNILIDHPQNKMAYEYMMACFLLNNDLASFMKYYSVGRNLKYDKIPSLFQQAIVLYSYELNRKGKRMGNLRLDKEIVNQFNEYISILGKNEGDKEAALPELKDKFGTTYWFYVHYTSPASNNKKQ